MDVSPERDLSAQNEETERVLRTHELGMPLFRRSVLEAIDQQLTAGYMVVEILDIHNNPQRFNIQSYETYYILYKSLQSLINPFSELLHLKTQPISITHIVSGKLPRHSLTDARILLYNQRKEWEKSDTCIWIKQLFANMVLSIPVKKIVCFGLGSPSLQSERYLNRSQVQHIAVKTIAEALGETRYNIPCYAQDPVYNDIDKELLNELGITPLVDPKGFLEVDKNTLVFSVSPNAPVKQIITDLQRPAAMLWDTVRKDGGPNELDPSSNQVLAMIQEYSQIPFQDCENLFGNLTIYLKIVGY